MANHGPEYIKRLPLGRAEEHSRTLAQYRSLHEAGIISGVEISGCDDCAPSMTFAGKIFPLSDVPQLPLNGCKRSPCCACVYVANVIEAAEVFDVTTHGSGTQTAQQSVIGRLVSWFRSKT